MRTSAFCPFSGLSERAVTGMVKYGMMFWNDTLSSHPKYLAKPLIFRIFNNAESVIKQSRTKLK